MIIYRLQVWWEDIRWAVRRLYCRIVGHRYPLRSHRLCWVCYRCARVVRPTPEDWKELGTKVFEDWVKGIGPFAHCNLADILSAKGTDEAV